MNKQLNELDNLRLRLDEIDKEWVRLLQLRFEVTRKVGVYKKKHKIKAIDKGREEFQFNRIQELAEQNSVNPRLAKDILRLIIDSVVEEHKKVATE
jgi:chorismate mutase